MDRTPPESGAGPEDAPALETDRRATRKAVTAAAIGNATEWSDFGVYSYPATTIGLVFHPSRSGGVYTPAWSLMAAGMIGVLVVWRMRESAGRPLPGAPAIPAPSPRRNVEPAPEPRYSDLRRRPWASTGHDEEGSP